jgi:hypothetical protein
MNKLTFKVLSEKKDIETVLLKTENYSGVKLPYSYAAQNKVVGVFLQEQLVAGYILVTKPEFRCLMFVPSEAMATSKLASTDSYDMMEVNGLWIGPKLKTPMMQAKVWAHLIKDIFLSKKKYVLLMRDSRNRNMARFFGMANPIAIYDGPPLLMAGDNSHKNIQVSFTTRWSIVLNSYKYAAEIRNRMKRADQFEKSQSFNNQTQASKASLV